MNVKIITEDVITDVQIPLVDLHVLATMAMIYILKMVLLVYIFLQVKMGLVWVTSM